MKEIGVRKLKGEEKDISVIIIIFMGLSFIIIFMGLSLTIFIGREEIKVKLNIIKRVNI